MSLALLAHTAATWTMVGLIWVVQLVLYPQFSRVGEREFPAYHRAHMRRMTWIVGPVTAVEGLSAAWLVWSPPQPDAAPWAVAGGVLFLFLLGWTALVSVPLHRTLERGPCTETMARLVATNWPRTAAWTARGVIALVLVHAGLLAG